jgi:hypothetical protein
MAYESLKDKFLKNEDYLYGKNPLTGDEKSGWYVEIRPNTDLPLLGGNPYLDTRSVPLVSAARDTVRVTRFLLSGKGLLFLGKQALLQTGNTFGQTRLLNPLFVPKQLVPFTHFPRHATSIPLIVKTMLGKSTGLKPPGGEQTNRLQKETIDRIRSIVRNKTKIPTQQKISFSNIIEQITSPFKAVADVSKGIVAGPSGQDERPEIKFAGGSDWWEIKKSTTMNLMPSTSANTREYVRAEATSALSTLKKVTKFSFTGLSTRPEFDPLPTINISKVDIVSGYLTNLNSEFQKTLTKYINDPKSKGLSLGSPNQTLSSARETTKNRSAKTSDAKGKINYGVTTIKPYDAINRAVFVDQKEAPDYIIFTIEAGDQKVQLRSFIIDFGVNVQADYSEKRYVGRYEKFITYQGVGRKIDLAFFLLPQNDGEVRIIWDKLDWLSRLAYPVKIQTAGYFEPPLAKLTIGRVFDRLPIFVNSVSWKLDNDSVWDIDREIPQYIKVSMSITIIESALNTLQNGALYEITKDNKRLMAAIGTSTPKVKQTTYVQPPLRSAPTSFPTGRPPG